MKQQQKYTMYFSLNNYDYDSYTDALVVELNQYFDKGYTITKCKGVWKGKTETSYKLEIIRDELASPFNNGTSVYLEKVLRKIADWIKENYQQESVLLTKENILTEII